MLNAEKFINAVAGAESSHGAHTKSGKAGANGEYAYGYMQIQKETAQDIAKKHDIPYDAHRLRHDPEYNVALGSAHFGDLLGKYDGDSVLALTAYNAGETATASYLKNIGDPRQTGDYSGWLAEVNKRQTKNPETQNYVEKILGKTLGLDLNALTPGSVKVDVTGVRTIAAEYKVKAAEHAHEYGALNRMKSYVIDENGDATTLAKVGAGAGILGVAGTWLFGGDDEKPAPQQEEGGFFSGLLSGIVKIGLIAAATFGVYKLFSKNEEQISGPETQTAQNNTGTGDELAALRPPAKEQEKLASLDLGGVVKNGTGGIVLSSDGTALQSLPQQEKTAPTIV